MSFFRSCVERFLEIATLQRFKGREKYKKDLDPKDPYDWIRMAEEEACDLWMYLQAANQEIKRLKRVEIAYKDLLKESARSTEST